MMRSKCAAACGVSERLAKIALMCLRCRLATATAPNVRGSLTERAARIAHKPRMGQCAARQVPARPKTATVIWLPSVDGKGGGCITTTTSTPFIPLRAARAVAKLCGLCAQSTHLGLCAQSTHLSATCVKCGLQRRANPRRWKCAAPLPDWRSAATQNSKAVGDTRMSRDGDSGAKFLPKDGARRIAANIAKLLELVRKPDSLASSLATSQEKEMRRHSRRRRSLPALWQPT